MWHTAVTVERHPHSAADVPASDALARRPVTAVLTFHLAADDPCFDGHFDGAPILPGVAHLGLAVRASAAVSGGAMLRGVRGVRFTRALGPGDAGEVVITPGDDSQTWRFTIRVGDETASQGWLIFGAAPTAPHDL